MKKPEPMRNINPFGLRLQPEIKAKLEEAAERNKRSLNAEISARLEESFQGQFDRGELLTAEKAREVALSARKNITANVRQLVIEELNRAILHGADTATVDLADFPVFNSDSEPAKEVAEPILQELAKAGYDTDWNRPSVLVVSLSRKLREPEPSRRKIVLD